MTAATPEFEMFDVVDEDDIVIGQMSRAEVHRQGLRHRSVHLLVFDRRGRIFLQKRSLNKDESPGLWDSSVAGHVDSGEDYDDCVIREAKEELGLRLDAVPERLFKFDATPTFGMEFCWVYRTVADGPFRLDPIEVDEGRWFEQEALAAELADESDQYTESLRIICHRLGH